MLQHRFPDNTLLSHDLIEGSYARAGLVSDIELIDDYPSHFSAYSRRKHRWVRGDWQITRWLRASVPDFHGRITPNPIAPISRWQILDNLRRSVIEPATLLLFLAGWFYLPGGALYWTVVTLAMLFMPVVANLLFSLLRVPWRTRRFGAWSRDTIGSFAKGSLMALLNVIFLLHQALLSIDAIVRSVMRVSVTRRKLLEWETAAEAESAARRKSTVDRYFEWTPWIAAALGLVLFLVRPAALPEAGPVLLLWFVSRAISYWLNRPPRTSNRQLRGGADEMLRESAEKIWRFFHDWSSPATNWLSPDSVRENGNAVHRLSPTNLGMLLNARVAAVQLGFLDTAGFIFETGQTLETVSRLSKYRGHLYNWYDGQTLQPLEPRFVSTVDSGNLVAALWTLRQAALASAKQNRRDSEQQVAALRAIANSAGELAAAMDFSFLYHRRKKVLSVGYDAGADRLEPSSYDLLASESRIACFVAIAKGDVPQEAWFHLGRSHTLYRGARVLVSWTGTMFEYLMPMLWMRHYADTITGQSATEVVRAQKEFARSRGVPWGISESACRGEEGGDYGYCAFGVPALAMKQTEVAPVVISPYSTFLALAVDPRAAVENLTRMAEYGWTGHYGFYEAIDYTSNGAEVIRSWMAHHQGMSLLAICNALFDNPLQQYFHSAPEVMATELLLNERVPSSLVVEEEPMPALVPETAAAAS